jgi:hypothetical protein
MLEAFNLQEKVSMLARSQSQFGFRTPPEDGASEDEEDFDDEHRQDHSELEPILRFSNLQLQRQRCSRLEHFSK